MDLYDIFQGAKSGRYNEADTVKVIKNTSIEKIKSVHNDVKAYLIENQDKGDFRTRMGLGSLNHILGKYSGISSALNTSTKSDLIPDYTNAGLDADDLNEFGNLLGDDTWGSKAVEKYMSGLMSTTKGGSVSGVDAIDMREETLEERSARSTNSMRLMLERTNTGRVQELETQIANMKKMLSLEVNEKTRNRITNSIEEINQQIKQIRSDAVNIEKNMLRMEAQYIETELEEQSLVAKELADADVVHGQIVKWDKNGKQLSASAINSQIDSMQLWKNRLEQDPDYRSLDHIDRETKSGPTVNVSVNVKTKDAKAGKVRIVETLDKIADNASINDDNEVVDGNGNVIARLVTLANGKKSFVKV